MDSAKTRLTVPDDRPFAANIGHICAIGSFSAFYGE